MTSRTPHVLWVNHFAAAPDMGGPTRHFEVGREMVRAGWQVTVVASDFHLHRRTYLRRKDANDRRAIPEDMDGVRFLWLWAAPYARNDYRRIHNWVSFGARVWRHKWGADRPDVVIGSSPHLLAALAAERAARRLNVPFVLEVRDLWPESLAVRDGRQGPAYHALAALAKYLYAKADHIIVLAEGVRDNLIARGITPNRITCIPNGVDVSAFPEVERAPSAALKLIYAGAHGPANGLDTVLEAAKLLAGDDRVSFVLMGDGPSKSSLVEQAKTMGLTNVEFATPVSKNDIPSTLASHDGGLMVLKDLPLFSFGVSPNKLFDYWAARLPIICNVAGETAGTVEQVQGGIVATSASADALASAVRKLLDTPAVTRKQMGERGRSWVERERDRPILAGRLNDVLRRLIPSSALR